MNLTVERAPRWKNDSVADGHTRETHRTDADEYVQRSRRWFHHQAEDGDDSPG
jgi:hypothetical protein